MTERFLLFLLSDRVFGVQLTGAKEIFPWRKPRPVPLAYSFVEGLIDYRGVVYPVFNLEQRLDLKRTGSIGFLSKGTAAPLRGRSIILLEEKNVPFGIVVDGVLKMEDLELTSGAPQKTAGIDAKFIKAVSVSGEYEVIIIDFERLFHAV